MITKVWQNMVVTWTSSLSWAWGLVHIDLYAIIWEIKTNCNVSKMHAISGVV